MIKTVLLRFFQKKVLEGLFIIFATLMQKEIRKYISFLTLVFFLSALIPFDVFHDHHEESSHSCCSVEDVFYFHDHSEEICFNCLTDGFKKAVSIEESTDKKGIKENKKQKIKLSHGDYSCLLNSSGSRAPPVILSFS
jgi:hypothetical protein